ncbi:alpha/beta fold hydrolase [Cryptosporangium phraense]|uniref:Alpha/beta hydrolase n=1 Tax=Cryptosporangium phraense TaxID=2593070 RepID=A0A545AVP8_9ACTN|nr:alpha/beta hydrolase [Cryptosporangium phraense]TQS44675.1 alpha/beta hydrolase [Cryptosporangium phraense]
MTAATLAVPGAELYYEVRGRGPLLVLAGAPMDARAFGDLADRLADGFTVLTTDPRGIGRSPVDDPDADSTPDERADDLAALIAHLDAGPAIAFGSSGGAVSVLALAQRHPASVSAVIPHEPPLTDLLDDRAEIRDRTEEMIAVHATGDRRGAWLLFLKNAGIELPGPVFEAMFAAPLDGRDAADENFQFAHLLRATTRWEPDVTALRAGPRIVVGIGEESAGQLCDRTARALAARLGTDPVLFPGDHTGFLTHGPAFAGRLRSVLS